LTLVYEQAMRVAQATGKNDEGARDWWIQTHEVQAHWKVPPQE
jgi:hypothetical protein